METKAQFKPDSNLKLMDQVRQAMRYYHYAYRTEQTYCDWILRFIRFHGGKTHPKDMGKSQIESFLSHLAVEGKVSASTQRQALNAIVFLYRRILDHPIEGDIAPVRAKRLPRIPVVLTQGEVQKVLSFMNGTHRLMTRLLYGSGLRLMECVRLRVQDLDFERGLIYVRAAKGDKDRATLFPKSIQAEVKNHLDRIRALHEKDCAQGYGEVYLP
ncbi:MAG: phage integrase N-terminal SAM-like domain-containing protein, partial [Chloroflexota bacterium]